MIRASSADAIHQYRQSMLGTVGFVPTMGALHDGHVALIRASQQQCDHTIVSIFVNPTQFAPTDDFASYPRSLSDDARCCESLGVCMLMCPTESVVYPNGNTTPRYQPDHDVATMLCGQFRPQFFYGVCNVVERLFRLVNPTHAFFGDKDIQQRAIIEHMVATLKIPITIVPCPIVRNKQGLALSSRNAYLTPDNMPMALAIPKALAMAKACQTSQDFSHTVSQALHNSGVSMDYASVFRPIHRCLVHGPIQSGDHGCVAARVGGIRLIDNHCF